MVRAVLYVLVGVLIACSPPRKVAVVERKVVTEAQETERIGGAHVRIVQAGDTLYAIAFANGLDPQRVAAWNGLRDTDILRIGQQIRLTQPRGFKAQAKPQTTEGAQQRQTVRAKTKRSSAQGSAGSDRPAPGRPAPGRPAPGTHTAEPSRSSTSTKAENGVSAKQWRWPSAGKVVTGFAPARGQQGIDIAGSLGQPVLASRGGEVVYVGNGLKGYGNLVILKHDETYLSAYAHNLETFVHEGQSITQGSRIASMGNTGNRAALHFQIRVHGDPVDPQKFLPR